MSTQMKKISEEIYYSHDHNIAVSKETIDFLKARAKENPRKRCRLCTHKDTNDIIQEMLIVHTKGNYVIPHKHLNKSESMHLIAGEIDLYLFDESGNITNIIQMGDSSTGKVFYHRMPESTYHTIIIKSDLLVFHETTKGPFNRADTIYAPWAPDEGDPTEQEYMNNLTKYREAKHGS